MPANALRFPLYDRADKMGVLDGKSALIVAPTATGKSHIGREAIVRALRRGESGTQAYLVPYRALAAEVFDAFADLLADETEARVRIVTGDYRDPLRPDEADLVVATYESFIGLVRRASFRPGIVVADEVHLIADGHRGPAVEGLFARLLSLQRAKAIIALSAVVDNGQQLAEWLGVPLLEGRGSDRPVPLRVACQWVDDLDQGVFEAVNTCGEKEQMLVFCSSRAGAERTARHIAEECGAELAGRAKAELVRLASRVREIDPDVEHVVDLLPHGVAYHHAGLPKHVRREIETAFRDRLIRVIAATPTLAAGVNLPAGIVVVKDITRADVVRGIFKKEPLPSGEVLNMLGRAARPYLVREGHGIALLGRQYQTNPRVLQLIKNVETGSGGAVESQLTASFESIMRFVLSLVADQGEASPKDILAGFKRTLAYHSSPEEVRFDRPFEEDMMEDLQSYKKVVDAKGKIRLKNYQISPDGVHATIRSGEKEYEVMLRLTGIDCTCPAASQFHRGDICKHMACAIHGLLFGRGVEPEARSRAIYNCGHVFGRSLDIGTRIQQAMKLLLDWRLVERVPAGWRATPLGEIASASRFDLLLIRQAANRVVEAEEADCVEIGLWAVEDFFPEDDEHIRWNRALHEWLGETDMKDIPMPTKYRGDFEDRLEDLANVCRLYERSAQALGKSAVAQSARDAAGAVRYGVHPELVALMGLNLPQLGRARARLLFQKGVRNLADLAACDPARVADARRAPTKLVTQWVERAREIHQARAVAVADRQEADQEFDELVSRFRLDPDSL